MIEKLDFAKKIVEDYLADRGVSDPEEIYFDTLYSSKLNVDEIPFSKKVFFCAENFYNRVTVSNAITRVSFRAYNFLYKFIPNAILSIPIWYPYKKHFKLLTRNDSYFVLTNDIQKKLSNVFILPLFMCRFRSHYEALLHQKKINLTGKKKFCAFVVTNPSNTERLEFYQKLNKYKSVDSYGKMFHNAEYTPKTSIAHLSNYDLYQQYKFVLCFENSYEPDYVTEKLPNAMMGNTIPIYKGASNVGDYFNKESFIDVSDFDSADQVIQKIIELDNDDEKYSRMLNQPYLTKKNETNIEKLERRFYAFLDNIFNQ